MTEKKKTMKELIAGDEILILPEVYDFRSQRTAEMCGFKATLLSSSEFCCAYTGIPDLGVLSTDEEVWISERISRASTIPVCIDAEDGFGSPLNTYYTAHRLTHLGGAGGVLITDEITDCPSSATQVGLRHTPIKVATAKIRAAAEGVAGTGGIVIARTDLDVFKDFNETVERCNLLHEAGADLVLILTLNNLTGSQEEKHEFLRKLHQQVPGPKFYPDLSHHFGVPDVDLDVLSGLNFKLVGIHYLLESAMLFMIEAGLDVMKNKNNLAIKKLGDRFPEARDIIAGKDASELKKGGKWWDLEEKIWGKENMAESTAYRVAALNEMVGDWVAGISRKEE